MVSSKDVAVRRLSDCFYLFFEWNYKSIYPTINNTSIILYIWKYSDTLAEN